MLNHTASLMKNLLIRNVKINKKLRVINLFEWLQNFSKKFLKKLLSQTKSKAYACINVRGWV